MSKVRTPTLPGVKMEGAGDPPPSVQLDPSSNRMIQKAHSSSEPPVREVAGPHLDFGLMRPWAENPVNHAVPTSSTHRNWDKKWVWFSASKFVVICHGSNWKGIHFLRKKVIWNVVIKHNCYLLLFFAMSFLNRICKYRYIYVKCMCLCRCKIYFTTQIY